MNQSMHAPELVRKSCKSWAYAGIVAVAGTRRTIDVIDPSAGTVREMRLRGGDTEVLGHVTGALLRVGPILTAQLRSCVVGAMVSSFRHLFICLYLPLHDSSYCAIRMMFAMQEQAAASASTVGIAALTDADGTLAAVDSRGALTLLQVHWWGFAPHSSRVDLRGSG